MNDSTNICLSCGLCCDGTLIGFVELVEEELPKLNQLMEIESVNKKGFFLQPCKRFCNGCTIYTQRPKQCASYKCGLLKSVEQNTIHFDLAVETILKVKQKKKSIEQKIVEIKIPLKSDSFYFRMVELKKMLQKNEDVLMLTQKQIELTKELKELDALLLSMFKLTLN